MLDLGTGSGVLGLRGASHCDRVTAVDINPRALMFAGFNAHLNFVDNIELLEGSWFEPVAGRRFDLIVSNPPYVVSPVTSSRIATAAYLGAPCSSPCAGRRLPIWSQTVWGS